MYNVECHTYEQLFTAYVGMHYISHILLCKTERHSYFKKIVGFYSA